MRTSVSISLFSIAEGFVENDLFYLSREKRESDTFGNSEKKRKKKLSLYIVFSMNCYMLRKYSFQYELRRSKKNNNNNNQVHKYCSVCFLLLLELPNYNYKKEK